MAMKLKNFTWLLAGLLLVGCSSDDDKNAADESGKTVDGTKVESALGLTEEQQAMVAPLNDFSVKLFQQLSASADSHSAVMSPLSTAFVLGMLNEGATGQTGSEISAALGLQGKDKESVNRLFAQYIDAIPSVDEQTTVAFANNVTVNQRYSLKDSYKKAVEGSYDASVFSLDFSTPDATKAVNSWCSQHSRGLIPSITDQLGENDVLCLLNAIYFKALWADKFEKAATLVFSAPTERLFLNAMGRTGSMLYCEQNGLQAVRLPLAKGAYAMTVVLPQADQQFSDFVRSLSARQLSGLTFSEQQVEASIPIFTTTADNDLITLLKSIGVKRMFDKDAELTEMTKEQLYVTEMKQKTRLGIDENGCEGAAVTLAELQQGSSFGEKTKVEFKATRPFVYFVSEVQSGTILFMGQFCGD